MFRLLQLRTLSNHIPGCPGQSTLISSSFFLWSQYTVLCRVHCSALRLTSCFFPFCPRHVHVCESELFTPFARLPRWLICSSFLSFGHGRRAQVMLSLKLSHELHATYICSTDTEQRPRFPPSGCYQFGLRRRHPTAGAAEIFCLSP